MAISSDPSCWLIDASIYVFRAWFLQGDAYFDTENRAVGAVHGFIDFIENWLDHEKPELAGIAFDESLGRSYRESLYPQYKANRASAPENLRYQFRCCREYLTHRGLVHCASKMYEADDVIASWARLQHKRGIGTIIVSADKDLAQLVRKDDLFWDYGRSDPFTSQQLTKQFGVKPEQIPDLLALAGDKADNIPGVPGIGMATAAKLITKFSTIDALLTSIEQVSAMKFRGSYQIQQQLLEHKAMIPTYLELTRLVDNLENIPKDLLVKTDDDGQALEEFLFRIGK